MKIYEFDGIQGIGQCIIYRLACDCGDPHCDLTMTFEKDEEEDTIYCFTLSFQHTLAYDSSRLPYYGTHWYNTLVNHWNRLWFRIFGACRLLFTGRIETSSELIIHDELHIQSLIRALKEAIEYMTEKKEHYGSSSLCSDKR